MQSKNYLILLFLVFSLPLARYSMAQESTQCVAVITEINGKALLKEYGTSQFVKAMWGTRLFNGDQIATNDKSEVKLLFQDNSFVMLGPNSTITIAGEESQVTESTGDVKKITSSMGVNISSLTFKNDEGKEVGALAGVRSVTTGQTIEPESPYNTLIKTDRPGFSWFVKHPYDNYNVNLYNSKGLVWSRKISGQTIKYPEDEKGLESGETYFWNVEGEYLIETDKSDNHKFTVLSLEKSREVKEKESAIRESFRTDPESSSLHSVLGAYYIEQGLLQDAISEFRTISAKYADAPMPHEILGSLYSEIGEKDKAIEELQKALDLTNSKEN